MKVNGFNYHVSINGSGDPLLLLHGFTGSSASWEAAIAAFSPHFTVIAPDLPGHGQTPISPYNQHYDINAIARVLWRILRRFYPCQPHILGYSMGGRLALYLAVIGGLRVRSLALESASPGLKTREERALRMAADAALADEILRSGVPAFVDYWENLPLFSPQKHLPEPVRSRLRAQRLANDPVGLALSLRGSGTGAQPSLWGRLGEVNAPTLLITGENDPKFHAIARAMQPNIAHAEHVVIPHAGHTPHLENPDAFHAETLDFLLKHTN